MDKKEMEEKRAEAEKQSEHDKKLSVYLEYVRFYAQSIIEKKNILMFPKVSIVQPINIDCWVATLTGCLLGEDAGRKDMAAWPADWWQALKDRWLPEWALKRWPVKLHHFTVDYKAVYTNFRPHLPNEIFYITTLTHEFTDGERFDDED